MQFEAVGAVVLEGAEERQRAGGPPLPQGEQPLQHLIGLRLVVLEMILRDRPRHPRSGLNRPAIRSPARPAAAAVPATRPSSPRRSPDRSTPPRGAPSTRRASPGPAPAPTPPGCAAPPDRARGRTTPGAARGCTSSGRRGRRANRSTRSASSAGATPRTRRRPRATPALAGPAPCCGPAAPVLAAGSRSARGSSAADRSSARRPGSSCPASRRALASPAEREASTRR